MGAVYNPIWVDFPMFYEGNPIMQEGHVFFLHMILMDSEAGEAMTLGHSVLVKADGIERLSRHGLDYPERLRRCVLLHGTARQATLPRMTAYSYRNDPAVPAFDDRTPVAVMDAECAICSGAPG